MKHYLRFMLVFIVSGLLLLCSASYIIDPYGIFAHDKDIFPRKVAAADKGRTVKPYQALNSKPFTVLVGNSRVEIGMPPEHAFYQGKPVYNMGLPGAGISMQYGYAMHAINYSDSVKQVIIALDLLDFTSRAENIVTTIDNSGWQWRHEALNSESFADKRRYLAERISLLFSLSALTDSVKTIVTQQNNVNALNRFGFNDGRVYHFHVASEGFGALYQQKAQEIDQRLGSQQLVFNRDSYHLAELDRFITQLKQQNITVYLLINPYQQPYLDQLTEHKLGQHLYDWKEQIIQLAKHHQLPLFDFAISSSLVTDVVAPNSKVVEDSPYFWEPAHYRPAFGDLILNSLLMNNCHQICNLYSQ
ncbi:hypothetical protein [Alishewanella tabrizica]|uniref:D-alanyl-lipoteichoic acid biosynthesis protein DltD n=1 Tax=Alishewanella tabrizica TaxID=671278 RepID=A0ABQ2WQM0_9ALTE|nr:hypothetical protein [Alishewanella tabrizica]GGW62776.1 hypothetical protein GCM10008111_18430 [Alishewanella tabrizica]